MSLKTEEDIEALSPRHRAVWLNDLISSKKYKRIENKLPVIKKMLAAGVEFLDKEKKQLIHAIIVTPARIFTPEFLAAGIKSDTTFEGYKPIERAVMAHDAVTLRHLLKAAPFTDDKIMKECRQEFYQEQLMNAARNLDTECVIALAETFGDEKKALGLALSVCARAPLVEGSALAPNPRKALHLKKKTMFALMNMGAEMPTYIDYYDLESDWQQSLRKEDFFKKFGHPEALEIEAAYKQAQKDLAKGLTNGFAATNKIARPGRDDVQIKSTKIKIKL